MRKYSARIPIDPNKLEEAINKRCDEKWMKKSKFLAWLWYDNTLKRHHKKQGSVTPRLVDLLRRKGVDVDSFIIAQPKDEDRQERDSETNTSSGGESKERWSV